LRRLTPHPRFIAARAIKQGHVYIGEAEETLGDRAGFRPGCIAQGHGCRLVGVLIVWSVRAKGSSVAIGLSESLQRPVACSARGVLLACEQKFGLDLKEAGFDCAGSAKSPQQACESMNERQLDHGSGINTTNEGALERAIGSNMFESRNDGLVSKPVTPGATA